MRPKGLKIIKCGMAALLFGAAAGLSACAPSAEFQTVPQAGAWRNGGYPSFNTPPKAETAQFSDAEQQSLSSSLRAEGQSLRASAAQADRRQKAQPGAAAAQKQANQEIEKTLRQITGH